MKALIAGGGIAGLATGIALRQAGIDVEVFERSVDLGEIGAGLMIWPNGARSLRALGVEIDALVVRQMTIRTWRGRIANHYPLDSIFDRYGFEPSFVHRADLQSSLAKRFGDDGLNFAHDVTEFKQNGEGAELVFRDGRTARGDLIVGADGLRSQVRRQLLKDGDPFYLGSTVWRGIVEGDAALIPAESGINWVGRGAEFLAFQLRGGRTYWAGVTKEPKGEKSGAGGHKADLMARFGAWTKPVPELIAATHEEAILRNDMYDRPRAKHWTGGRVVLVGDAAHPMTPNAGQGACQALEDAVALAGSLQRTSNLGAAFARYEAFRMHRANRIVAMSHQATRAVQLENRFLCAVRDVVGSFVAQRLFLRTLDGILTPEPYPV